MEGRAIYYQDLDEFLFTETESEKWHLEHPGELSRRYRTMQTRLENSEKVYLFDLHTEITPDGIALFRDSRYTNLPLHVHTYMEVNYVYSGSTNYYIEGKKISLSQGDLILVEPDVMHGSDYRGKTDIVLNIVFEERFFSTVTNLHQAGRYPLYDFIVDNLNRTRKRKHYLVFRKDPETPEVEMTLQSIARLVLVKNRANHTFLLDGYIRLFFLHLLNAVCNDEESEYATENDVITAEILQRISADPANVTLKEIAQKQGYNYNYLSNLIKENTGRSFSELKKSAQYGNVCELLIKTNYPVEEIARMCGFGNLSYFYKNFVLRYGVSPNHFRKKDL